MAPPHTAQHDRQQHTTEGRHNHGPQNKTVQAQTGPRRGTTPTATVTNTTRSPGRAKHQSSAPAPQDRTQHRKKKKKKAAKKSKKKEKHRKGLKKIRQGGKRKKKGGGRTSRRKGPRQPGLNHTECRRHRGCKGKKKTHSNTHKQGNPSPEGAEQTERAPRPATGKGEAHENAFGRPARPTRPGRARTRTHPRDPSVVCSYLKGVVWASTQDSSGAPAGAPVQRWTVRETGHVSDRVHTRQTTAAHAARDQRRRDQPGTTPSPGPKRVRSGASPAPLPWQGPAAGTKSPVLGRPPRAPRSCRGNPGLKAPGRGWHHRDGQPTRALTATGLEEARRNTRGHEACRRGTPPSTAKAHGRVQSNNGHRVPQTREVRKERNEPRHGRRCQATRKPHITNPNQERRGTSGARTQTHGAQQPQPGEPKTPTEAHTPTPHTRARNGGGQADRAHRNTRPNTPPRIGGAKAETETQAHTHHKPQQGFAGYTQGGHTNTHAPTPQSGIAGRSPNPIPTTHTHTAHPGQEWQGTGGACTQAHTPQHPSRDWRSGSRNPNPERCTTSPSQDWRSTGGARTQTHGP